MRTHAIGWPLAVAPIFRLINEPSIFVNMFYAQLVNIAIGSLIIFLVYLIARQLLSEKWALVAVTLTTFSFWFLFSTLGFYAEPLFTALFLLSIYYLIKGIDQPKLIPLTAILAALTYWLKPTGILILPIILLTIWFLRKSIPGFSYWLLLGVIIIFSAVSAPFLYQRYLHFGSPFFYGENSRYFVDNYEQLWNKTQSPVSFAQYLVNHNTLRDYLNRFLIRGLGGTIFTLIYVTLPLSIFSLWGMLQINRRRMLPIGLALIVWVIAFMPIYDIYIAPRHFFHLIPLMAITATAGIAFFVKDHPYRYFLTAMVILLSLLSLGVSFIYPEFYFIRKRPVAEVKFGRWVAGNIRGKMAIAFGGDYIMMNLPDTTVAKAGLFDMSAPRSGLSLVYPGHFTDPDKLVKWLKDNRISYLAIDKDYLDPYRNRLYIYKGKTLPQNLTKIYHDYDTDSSWEVELYKLSNGKLINEK